MDVQTKIKMVRANLNISEAELARRLGTTSQALGQRMKTGKFTTSDLESIAAALGVKYVHYFELPDGSQV